MTRQRNKERQKGKRKTEGKDKQGKTMNTLLELLTKWQTIISFIANALQ
jgi:hypothetical protein